MRRKEMKNQMFPRYPLLLSLALVIGLLGFIQFQPTGVAAQTEGSEQMESCLDCHDTMADAYKHNPHKVIDQKGLAGRADGRNSCEACHGNGDQHLESGGEDLTMFSFKTGDLGVKNQKCMTCHSNSAGRFMAGSHGKSGMDCTGCHVIHGKSKGSLLKGHSTKMCASCHQDVVSRFKFNERHRLMEGAMGCEDCHDPHEPSTAQRLGGFKQEACFKCHTDKQGPFLFEHGSITIDGCTACHDVHGSPNRHMLKDQSSSQLCYGCHTHVPGWHSRFTPESNCANCHATIHGSNLSSKFLK